jgi:hypothetical protein
MQAKIYTRIDLNLKNKIKELSKAEGKTVDDVVRALLVEYIQKKDIKWYIKDLWERMGRELRAKGFTRKDIPRVIRKVREER